MRLWLEALQEVLCSAVLKSVLCHVGVHGLSQ